MSEKHTILKGAALLTAAGLASRILGFFYRIFLSRTIGAEGVGIYQLIFPVYALAASLTGSGIQTCLSRFVSAKTAFGDLRGARRIFSAGMLLSLSLSFLTSWMLLHFHEMIATGFVHEQRTSDLLRLLAFAVPFGSVHACVNGYYFGLKRTAVPAVGQLLEVTLRLGSTVLLCRIFTEKGLPVGPALAVCGLIVEEAAASLFSLTALMIRFSKEGTLPPPFFSRLHYLKELVSLATPLTLNRVLVNLLQTVEALLVPIQLQAAGMDGSSALTVYGTLTGMALPFILFPTALTSSISTMLLPTVSEAQAKGNVAAIRRALRKTCGICLLLGACCFAVFFFLGDFLGQQLFHSAMAGDFLCVLAWICPLFYLTPTLLSVLNGLGKSGSVFFHNICSVLVRIAFLVLAMPRLGILGYFYGVLASQLLLFGLALFRIRREILSEASR